MQQCPMECRVCLSLKSTEALIQIERLDLVQNLLNTFENLWDFAKDRRKTVLGEAGYDNYAVCSVTSLLSNIQTLQFGPWAM